MLPGGSSRVGDNLFVRRENSKTVFKGLADQHAVKRIFVVIGQSRLVQRIGFLQGEFFNIVDEPLRRHKEVRRHRHWKLTQTVL